MILYFLLACEFGTIDLNLEEQIHAKLAIVRKSSLIYLMENLIGTRFHVSLEVKSLIWRSPQAGEAFLQRTITIALELGIV